MGLLVLGRGFSDEVVVLFVSATRRLWLGAMALGSELGPTEDGPYGVGWGGERVEVEDRDATSLSVDGGVPAAGPLAVTAGVDDGGGTGGRVVSMATAEDGSDDEEELELW